MDKIYYGLAAQEVASGEIDAALFIKAVAIARGDEREGRAAYITLRAEELSKLHRKDRALNVVGAVATSAAAAVTSDAAKRGLRHLVISVLVVFACLVSFVLIWTFMAERTTNAPGPDQATSTQVEQQLLSRPQVDCPPGLVPNRRESGAACIDLQVEARNCADGLTQYCQPSS